MDLIKSINEVIQAKSPDLPRRYIGASSIGNPCEREIWYRFNDVQGESFPTTIQTTFEIGRRLEEMILDYIDLAALDLERAHPYNNHLFVQDDEVLLFQGHMDGLLFAKSDHETVLEIKTCRDSSFKAFVSQGLQLWSPAYYAQLQSYLGMTGLANGVLIAINKDTSELHQEWVNFDEILYAELKQKARRISLACEPPDKINKSPVYKICNRCKFKKICHGSE